MTPTGVRRILNNAADRALATRHAEAWYVATVLATARPPASRAWLTCSSLSCNWTSPKPARHAASHGRCSG